MRPSYDCQPVPLDGAERLSHGDEVSWRLDGEQRRFGHLVRRASQDGKRAYLIRDKRGALHIIPANMITKEVG